MPTCCRTLNEGTGQEQPDFLPMFPWYSGTSADMYRTVIDLVISVKLFLGRFDMRTMEVGSLAFWLGLHANLLHNSQAQESLTGRPACLPLSETGSVKAL